MTMHDSPEGQTQHWTPEEQMWAEFEAWHKTHRQTCGIGHVDAVGKVRDLEVWEACASQYSATIARLEERLAYAEQINHVKQVGWDQANERAAAAELSNRQLRELLEKSWDTNNVEPLNTIVKNALAQLISTEALDVYVASKIKEQEPIPGCYIKDGAIWLGKPPAGAIRAYAGLPSSANQEG